MRQLRALALFGFVFLASCGHYPHEWAAKMPNVITDIKESLFVTISFGEKNASSGNAFMIEPGVLMTAGHVCAVAGENGSPTFLIKDKKVYGGRIAWIDEDADVCIIESEVPGRPLAMLAEVDDYDDGYAISY